MPFLYATGAICYGSLYLLCVACFGYLFGKPDASLLAIADLGLTYLYFVCAFQVSCAADVRGWHQHLLSMLTIVTIFVGFAAGILLF